MDDEEPELTNKDIHELSMRITSREKLRELGTVGLKLPDHQIDEVLYDHRRSIRLAVLDVIYMLLRRDSNRVQAYKELYSALQDIGLNMLANEMGSWSKSKTSGKLMFLASITPVYQTVM